MDNQRMCSFCGVEPADSRYREVTGVEERRAQGGANKIIGRVETGRVPCRSCVRKMEDNVSLDQATLL